MDSLFSTIERAALGRRGFAVLMAVSVLIIAVDAFMNGLRHAFIFEGGGIETAGFLLFISGIVISGALVVRHAPRAWPVPALFLLLALRELDFQNWWFDPGLLRTELFSTPAPIWQKIVSGLAIALILLTLWRLMRIGLRPWLSGLAERAHWALVLFAAGFVVLLALFADGASGRLRALGVEVPPSMNDLQFIVEESLEFAFAVLLVWSVILFARRALAQAS